MHDDPPWENDPDAQSFGAWLRRQREVREIGLREIAEATKVSVRYLEALEQDRFDVLPAQVFAKGFLREYARFVGLDPDEVVNSYIAAVPAEKDAPPESEQRPVKRTNVWPLLLLVLALLVVVAGLFYYAQRTAPDVETPAAVPPAEMAPADLPVPDLGAGAATEAEPEAPLRLTMDFSQNCWVVAFVDGARTVSELRVQGESLRLEAQEQIRLVLGNVDGVTFELNGERYQPAIRDDEEFVIDLATPDQS